MYWKKMASAGACICGLAQGIAAALQQAAALSAENLPAQPRHAFAERVVEVALVLKAQFLHHRGRRTSSGQQRARR